MAWPNDGPRLSLGHRGLRLPRKRHERIAGKAALLREIRCVMPVGSGVYGIVRMGQWPSVD